MNVTSNISIYDPLTKKMKSLLLPNNLVNIYCCGPTVYDDLHIGHMRTYTSLDMIIRSLNYMGYQTYYVRNFTDIDDKIIAKSKKTNTHYQDVAYQYIINAQRDFREMGLLKANSEPTVTENLEVIIKMIEKLIAQGNAYQVMGDVYFDISSYDSYGILSKRSLDLSLKSNSSKRNPNDFVLWKEVTNDDPSFDSPFGFGRPGWHISCSAMINSSFNSNIVDIHAGGLDLIFPHHENELAQSTCYHGFNPIRNWLHFGSLTVKAVKMSKSLDNHLTFNDFLQQYNANDLRLFAACHHYRQDVDFTLAKMDSLKSGFTKLVKSLKLVDSLEPKPTNPLILHNYHNAISNNFNFPQIIGLLFNQKSAINTDISVAETALFILTNLGFNFNPL